MNKIIEGAKEAVKVARCDHDLTRLRRLDQTGAPPRFDVFHCSKCFGAFYVPIKPSDLIQQQGEDECTSHSN